MASMARIRQWKLGQRSGLLEDFVTERSALESNWHNIDEGRRRRATVMGCHACTAADATAQGGRRTRGYRHDEGVVTCGRRIGENYGDNASERTTGEDLGEDGPDRWATFVSNDGLVMGWLAGRLACGDGPGSVHSWPAIEKTAHTDFFHFKSFSN
jgi:hypothetical protein